MNRLKNLHKLNNKYFAIRHGQSKANIKNIIISNPKVGTIDYGLTDTGKQQMATSIEGHVFKSKNSVIISSDFLRAIETTQEILNFTKHEEYSTDIRLRERFFGDYEGKNIDYYFETWSDDKESSSIDDHGIECTDNVMKRMTSVILDCENNFKNKIIYLVSHGDPLQILETAFIKKSSNTHRNLKKIENAEIREMILSKII